MTITHLSAWLMVAAGGLFSGGISFVAVERLNLWQRMPVDQYVVDFRRSVYRADLLMPIMGNISALGAVVFALNSAARPATPLSCSQTSRRTGHRGPARCSNACAVSLSGSRPRWRSSVATASPGV